MEFLKHVDVHQPSGVYYTHYRKDLAVFRTHLQRCALLGFLLLMFLVPIFGVGTYWLNLAISIFITIIAVEGLNLITGYCGQISLAQAAFVGVGAYSSAILCGKAGFPFWISILCAGLITGVVGLVFGIPALRLKGFYLAMSTLAAQFILIWLFIHLRPLTGGTDSLYVPPPQLGSYTLDSENSIYYLSLCGLIIMTYIAKNISRTKVGRGFVAVRDNDLGASVMGINLFKYKLIAFFVCSFFAGISGALYSVWLGHIHPENFMLMDSVWYLGMIVIGGMGTTLGPIFGVTFFKLLEEIIQVVSPIIADAVPFLGGKALLSVAAMGQMVFGAVIGIFLIWEPRGIARRWEILKTFYRMWPFSH